MGRPTLHDLDALVGEILPERTVLSTVSSPLAASSGGSSAAASAAPHDAGHGATAMNSCTTTTSYGTPGLLGSLGLGSENPHTTTTCTPGAVASH